MLLVHHRCVGKVNIAQQAFIRVLYIRYDSPKLSGGKEWASLWQLHEFQQLMHIPLVFSYTLHVGCKPVGYGQVVQRHDGSLQVVGQMLLAALHHLLETLVGGMYIGRILPQDKHLVLVHALEHMHIVGEVQAVGATATVVIIQEIVAKSIAQEGIDGLVTIQLLHSQV